MQAIILCGGMGTRLRSVIGEAQKTMTETGGEPFLVNVIKYLKTYDVSDVIFATGYKSKEVRDYFGDKYYFGVKVSYAEEKEPLGTGGAIRNCLDLVKGDSVFVLNGDTLFSADLKALKENFSKLDADMSIACKSLKNRSRYGTIKIDKASGVIKKFLEKVDEKEAPIDNEDTAKYKDTVINGGVYIIKKSLIESIPSDLKISLEIELMPKWLKEGRIIGGIVCDVDFVDIGTPESLQKFKEKVEDK